MKKFLVLGLTGLLILFISFVGLTVAGSFHAPLGMSADALSGDSSYRPQPEEMAPSPVELNAAPPPKRDEGGIVKMIQKRAAPSIIQAGLVDRGGGGKGSRGIGAVTTLMAKDSPSEAATMDGELAQPAATRAWFPETFLFEPLIVTDAQGRANIPVKVPDRLTTWRLLALAHSRQGSQAGSVASFLGTLPTYVEPVTPPFLYAGDSVRLPIQVVNTTDGEITTSLAYAISGATLSSTGGAVKVPAGGNALQYVTLSTTRPGTASFKATLGSTDAIEKSIELKPAGRRELVSKAGTLAAPRTFSLSGPSNPLPGTEAVRLRVYPGALGLIRNELSAAPGRGGD